MGSLVYLRHGIENSPYRSLLETNQWAEICNIFTRDACALLGLSVESPLSVRLENNEQHTRHHLWLPLKSVHVYSSSVLKHFDHFNFFLCMFFLPSFASGCMALPVLMNIKQVIEQRQCSGVWTHKDELPVSFVSLYIFQIFWSFFFFFFILSHLSFCLDRLKLTWAKSAGTTLFSPARSCGSKPQRATRPWSSSVATLSPETPSTNWPMLGSKSAMHREANLSKMFAENVKVVVLNLE